MREENGITNTTKNGGPQKTGMVEKIPRWNGSGRFVATLGCLISVMSCTGCATAKAQPKGMLTKVPAAARAKDYAATGEYLHARTEALRATMAALPLNISSAEAVISRVRSECAGALSGTPAVAAVDGRVATRRVVIAGMLDLEINGSVLGRWAKITYSVPLTPSAAHVFAAKVASLRWADPGVTNLVRALVGVEEQLFAISPINVCHVIHGWAESGYKTYPGESEPPRPSGAIGQAWHRALLAVGCQRRVYPTEATLLAVLHPYERPGNRLTTRQVEKTERSLWVAFETAERVRIEALWRVLGLPPLRKVTKRLTPPPPLRDCMSLP